MIYEKSFPFQHAPQRSLWIKLWKHFLLRVLYFWSAFIRKWVLSLIRLYCSHFVKVEARLKVNNQSIRTFFNSIELIVFTQIFECKVPKPEKFKLKARRGGVTLTCVRCGEGFHVRKLQLCQFTENLHALCEGSSLWTLLFTLQLL